MEPIISIITINFNNINGLKKTLRSVETQMGDIHYEHIIIDGGSTDGSAELINEYKEKNYQCSYAISEKDNGIYNAMNKGVNIAQGDYCHFLNSGDFFPSNAVELLSLNKGADICVGKALCFYSSSHKHIVWIPPQTVTLASLFTKSFNHQAAFIRTTLMKELRYDENYKIIADWDFFIRAFIVKNCS